MKNLLLLVALIISACSCNSARLGTKPDKHPKPYVKTNDGRVITLDTLKEKRGKLVSHQTKYDKDSLQEYSNGKHVYRRLSPNSFAVKKYDGDITVYTTSSTYTSTSYVGASGGGSGWQTSSHSHTSHYMQTRGSAALQLINYKNVEAALSKDEPAYRYIGAYHNKRLAGKITMWAGVGLFVGGIVLASSSTSNSTDLIAGSTIFAGLTAVPTGLMIKASALNKIFKAVGTHNGVGK